MSTPPPDGSEPSGGRVLDVADGGLTVSVDKGLRRVTIAPGRDFKPGDLVRLGPDGDVTSVFAHPTGNFPRPGTEAMRTMQDPELWTRLERRSKLRDETRTYFRSQGMLEVDTPLVVKSAGTETHIEPLRLSLRPRTGAPAETRFLITSPEYHMKRLLVAGSPPLFQLCKVFRDGERGDRHRPEFTMLEWYRPWADWHATMADCERWFLHLSQSTSMTYQGRTIDLSPPWPRIRFLDALQRLGGVPNPGSMTPEEQLQLLTERVEPQLGASRPVFLTHWPATMASLARRCPDDPDLAERFELYIAGIELANGFGELTDASEQRTRCLKENSERVSMGLPAQPLDEEFLGALEDGLPPSSGVAVGFDRVAMLLCDVATIDDILPF